VDNTLDFPAAFDDPHLFGPFFQGPSWDGWRAIGRAADALPMTPQQLITFGELAGGREPPKRRVRELWVAAGRRAGKGSFVSARATFASLQHYEGLRPGETPTIVCLAVDKQQARIILRYIKGFFEQIELLQGLVERETADGLLLTNGCEILVMTNSLRAVRGRTIVFAVLDEVAFFRSDESVNPDHEVYNAIVPAMVTIPNSMLVAISTTHRRDGLLYRARP
jgi:phage terminase large subunit-like protein